MSYIIAGFALALFWIIKKKAKKDLKWWLKGLLFMIFAASFANTRLGGWVAQQLGRLLGLPAGWVGATGALLATCVLLLLMVVVFFDIKRDRKMDGPAVAAVILIPLLALVALGPVANGATTISDSIANAAAAAFGTVTGR